MKFKKKYIVVTIVIILVLLLSGFILFQISKSRTFQFFGGLTDRVETDKKIIALTFDDAPTEYSNDILKLLQEKNVKATFYMIGKNIEQHPDEAKAIVQAGMEVGNHSYTHERFLLKSQGFIDEEIQKTNTLIRQIGYKDEITFRPPNGKKLIGLPWYLQQHGIKTIMWDVEPDTYLDNTQPLKKQIASYVAYTVDYTQPGSIILMHPFCKECDSARASLPIIIDYLQKKGYMFVTVSELLKERR
jgi:chitin deacetylase